MKLLGRKHVQAEARVFSGGNAPLVRLALGADVFVMDAQEAFDLAAGLVAAADEARKLGGGPGDGR